MCFSFSSPTGVDGGWSAWASNGTCSVTCGIGTMQQTRTCTNPPASGSGLPCVGTNEAAQPCDTGVACPGELIDLKIADSRVYGCVYVYMYMY